MVLFFIYTHDNIQKAVKMETSLLAERRASYADGGQMSGEMYNDLLIMDEEYEALFKRLFLQAHAEVIKNIPVGYLKNTPTDLEPIYREFPDFRQDRDFVLWLILPETFPLQYKKSIDIKIEQFIIDYICWRWLENKSPQDANFYFVRLEQLVGDWKKLLANRTVGMRRMPSFP